uniref:Uncharacterized protein n=1 Tax=Cacopsylla melanoneura TaxID=428564 RepID=A0A8D8M1T2_9HEMI
MLFVCLIARKKSTFSNRKKVRSFGFTFENFSIADQCDQEIETFLETKIRTCFINSTMFFSEQLTFSHLLFLSLISGMIRPWNIKFPLSNPLKTLLFYLLTMNNTDCLTVRNADS